MSKRTLLRQLSKGELIQEMKKLEKLIEAHYHVFGQMSELFRSKGWEVVKSAGQGLELVPYTAPEAAEAASEEAPK